MQKVIEAVRAGLQGNNNEGDRLFYALFEAALDAMVIADDEGRYVAVNPTDPSANHGPWPVDASSPPAAPLEPAVGTTPKGCWDWDETVLASSSVSLAKLVELIYDVGDRTQAESALRQ